MGLSVTVCPHLLRTDRPTDRQTDRQTDRRKAKHIIGQLELANK